MATEPSPEPILSGETIAARVRELARSLSKDYRDSRPVLLIVLKGAAYFGMDLARAMSIPVCIEFVRARSYAGQTTTGEVELTVVPMEPMAGRDVLIVEDILDTGLTASAISEWVGAQQPASLGLCTLLDKPSNRRVEIEADYVGFTIDNHFVVGYGLDFQEDYRELPEIHRLIDNE